jgi:hypothetical protein
MMLNYTIPLYFVILGIKYGSKLKVVILAFTFKAKQVTIPGKWT